MKQVASLLISVLFAISGLAQGDTLRNYDPTLNSIALWGGSEVLMSRFEPPAPGWVKAVVVYLDGDNGDEAMVHLYGHEGGAQFPQRDPQLNFHYSFLDDKIDPIAITKTTDGIERISVEFPEPVWMANNQFFVSLDGFTGNAKLVMSTGSVLPSCEASASHGGAFQVITKGNPGSGTMTGSNTPFWVDAIVEFPTMESPQLFKNETGASASGIPDDLSNRGIAAVDYDEDHQLDLLIRGRMFHNEGNGKFTETTATIGLEGSPAACAVIDIDNDEDLDIIFLDVADSSYIYVNQGGGNYVKTYVPSIPALRSLHSYSFADLNSDGLPDLFLSQLWGTYPVPYPNFLLFNDGNWGFTDESQLLYPQHDGASNYPSKTVCDPGNTGTWLSNGNRNRRSRGSSFVDYDNDGDLDLYVSNYFLEPDEFYENNGNGTFTEKTINKGFDQNPTGGNNHGTGVDWGDYNRDGYMDLITPQFAHPGWTGQFGHRGTNIYRNLGPPDYQFLDTYGANGMEWEETHAGATWGDVNNDGLLDIYISTYYGCRYTDLYLQEADHTFALATFDYGIDNLVSGVDGNWFDYNSDGLLDLAAGENNQFRLFRNDGNYGGTVLKLKILSTSANRYAIGTKVKVHVSDGIVTQEVNAGRGQNMQRPYVLHFGLGSNTSIDMVEVTYPGGNTETYTDLEVNKYYVLTEGNQSQEIADLSGGGDGFGPIGLEEENLNSDLKLFPNPSGGIFAIEFEGLRGQQTMIRVLDLKGQIVYQQNRMEHAGTNRIPIELDGNLKNGVYFVELKNDLHHQRAKLVVAR